MMWPLEIVNRKFVITSDAFAFLGLDSNRCIRKHGPQYIEDKFSTSNMTQLFSKGKRRSKGTNKRSLMTLELFVCLLFGGLPGLTRSQPSRQLQQLRTQVIQQILGDDVPPNEPLNNSVEVHAPEEALMALKTTDEEPMIVNLEPGPIQVTLHYAEDSNEKGAEEDDIDDTSDLVRNGESRPGSQSNNLLANNNRSPRISPSVMGQHINELEQDSGAVDPSEVSRDEVQVPIVNAQLNATEITYQLIMKGPRRNRIKLLDSEGYYYSLCNRHKQTKYWQCVCHVKENACPATVAQRNDVFSRGRKAHNHPSNQHTHDEAHDDTEPYTERTGTKRKRQKLIDSQCSSRKIINPSKATVVESHGGFTSTEQPHNPKSFPGEELSFETDERQTTDEDASETNDPKGSREHQSNSTVTPPAVQDNTNAKEGDSGTVQCGHYHQAAQSSSLTDQLSEEVLGGMESIDEGAEEANEDRQSIEEDLVFQKVSFRLEEEGTKRKRPSLIDSLGYHYSVTHSRSNITYWKCTTRPKENPCKASAIEKCGNFSLGRNPHNHQPTREISLSTTAQQQDDEREKEEGVTGEGESGEDDEDTSPTVEDDIEAKEVICYLEEEGTSRQRSKVVDSQGYCYNQKRGSIWQCSRRLKVDPCKAKIIQRHGRFYAFGQKAHNHIANQESYRPGVTYKVEGGGGTNMKHATLTDSLGYSYNLLKRRSTGLYWQCCTRPKENPCRATVIEKDGKFRFGRNPHNHQLNEQPSGLQEPLLLEEVTFRLEKEGTQRNRPMLIDSLGYHYNVFRSRSNSSTNWQCTTRPKYNPCKASVIEKFGKFSLGQNPHNHQPTREIFPSTTAQQQDDDEVQEAVAAGDEGEIQSDNDRLVTEKDLASQEAALCLEEEETQLVKESTRTVADVDGFAFGQRTHSDPVNSQKQLPKSIEKETAAAEEHDEAHADPNQSMDEETRINETDNRQSAVSYHIEKEGSKRKKQKLIDSQGYNYNVKRKSSKGTTWQCSARTKVNPCGATVLENQGQFTFGKQPHNHESSPRIQLSLVTAEPQSTEDALEIDARVSREQQSNSTETQLTVQENTSAQDADQETVQITCHIRTLGTDSKKRILTDSLGFCYTVCSRRLGYTCWQCSRKSKEIPCKATVIENDGKFRYGKHDHDHQATQPSSSTPQQQLRGDMLRGMESIDDEGRRSTEEVSFRLEEGATQRKRPMLIDSLGYHYNVFHSRSNTTYWQCTTRPKKNRCKASVIERGGKFSLGQNTHNHQPIREICLSATAQQQDDERKEQEGVIGEGEIEDNEDTSPTVEDDIEAEEVICYLEEEGTSRQRPKVIDSQGYCYNRKTGSIWQCSRRLKVNTCKAKIIQRHGRFYAFGQQAHNHIANQESYRPGVTYQVEERGPNMKHATLTDSLGYNYHISKRRSTGLYWQCSTRPKENPCSATVIEKDGKFRFGRNPHNHQLNKQPSGPQEPLYEDRDQTVEELPDDLVATNGLQNTSLAGLETETSETSYRIKETGTKRKRAKLTDKEGYCYSIFRKHTNSSSWLCTRRPKENPCKALITIENGQMTPGTTPHNHPADPPPDTEFTCHLEETGSQRKGARLIDNKGYCYNRRTTRNAGIYWQCTTRPKLNSCKASVIENDGKFRFGENSHNHPPKIMNSSSTEEDCTGEKQHVTDFDLSEVEVLSSQVEAEEVIIPSGSFQPPNCTRTANTDILGTFGDEERGPVDAPDFSHFHLPQLSDIDNDEEVESSVAGFNDGTQVCIPAAYFAVGGCPSISEDEAILATVTRHLEEG